MSADDTTRTDGPTDTADPFADYPSGACDYYGVPTYELGEDGDELIVGGHGRRSYAALARALRGDEPVAYSTWDRRSDFRPSQRLTWDVQPRWVRFLDTCGCTEAEHAEHAATAGSDPDDVWDECSNHCARRGMSPCASDPEYAWFVDYSDEPVPGALPVLRVRL